MLRWSRRRWTGNFSGIGVRDAVAEGREPEGGVGEHPGGEGCWQAAAAGGCDCAEHRAEIERKADVKKKTPKAHHGVANKASTAEGMMSQAMRDTKGGVRKAKGAKK